MCGAGWGEKASDKYCSKPSLSSIKKHLKGVI